MKVAVLLVGLLTIVYSNPAANSKEWIWKPLMPKVSTITKTRPFHQIPVPPKMTIRKPGTWTPASCGPTSNVDPAIVNGEEAPPHAYPWQAALFINEQYFCGGTLISDEWVLTAGHCTDIATFVSVVLGAANIKEDEPTQQTINASEIITHKDYDNFFLWNDVGLLRLSTPAQFTDAVQPVCLPSYSDKDLAAGVMLTATGWGVTSDSAGATVSDTLNEVTDPSISNSMCNSYYGETIVTPATICTSTAKGHQGTCSGDSGGPLNYVSGGKTYTRGVTSFVSSAGCTSGFPDGFTRTTHYLDWIESNTGIAIAP